MDYYDNYAVTIAGMDCLGVGTCTAPTEERRQPPRAPQPTARRPAARPPHIQPGEDAYSMPPRPRVEDLAKRYLQRLVDLKTPTRGIKAIRDSATRFVEATDNAELDGLGMTEMQAFLDYLKQRTYRDKPLAARTIHKHFAAIAGMLAYGGPSEGPAKQADRTACRLGLFGFDQAGRPNPVPALYRNDLPRVFKQEKPVPTIRQVTRWVETCAKLEWGKLQHNVPKQHAKGLWLSCLLVFLRNTGIRLESLVHAEWKMLDGHWLRLPREIVKKKDQPLNVYVNSWALGAAMAVKTDDSRIFSWRSSESYLDNIIQAIYPEDETYRLHRLRAMLINDLIEADHEIIAQCHVGHKGGVTQQNYASYKRLAPKILENAAILRQPNPCNLPLPARIRIRTEEEEQEDGQLRLFAS